MLFCDVCRNQHTTENVMKVVEKDQIKFDHQCTQDHVNIHESITKIFVVCLFRKQLCFFARSSNYSAIVCGIFEYAKIYQIFEFSIYSKCFKILRWTLRLKNFIFFSWTSLGSLISQIRSSADPNFKCLKSRNYQFFFMFKYNAYISSSSREPARNCDMFEM